MDRKLALAAVLAASLSALPIRAQDSVPARSKVRITGSGNNVVLERQAAPQRAQPKAARPAEPAPAPAPGPIDIAAEMKSSGASDASVVTYLRSRDDLPQVIDASDVRKLRRAGAGHAVIAWLSSATAFDIGETGEGREVAEYAPPAPAMDYGAQVYDAGYPVPYFYGNGYFAGGYGGRGNRLARIVHPGAHPGLHSGGHPGSRAAHPAPHGNRIGGSPARRLFP